MAPVNGGCSAAATAAPACVMPEHVAAANDGGGVGVQRESLGIVKQSGREAVLNKSSCACGCCSGDRGHDEIMPESGLACDSADLRADQSKKVRLPSSTF